MSGRTWLLAFQGLLGLATLSPLLAGCSHLYLPAASANPPTFAPEPARFFAGAARADITPPPGVASFGHGPDSRVTNGVWTRLYCRAFVLRRKAEKTEKTADAALAIVPCDLPAMSAILQRTVAEELAVREVPIPASRLMISATHTHAGPGHYLDGEGYAGLGSSQLPGYDEQMTRFLAKRIAQAVQQAYETALTHGPAELRWSRRQVLGLTRNRAIGAFIRNDDPPWAAGCKDRSELCAIDPELSVLELHTTSDAKVPGCPIGALTFFAMHPTVLPNTNQLLGADAFGVASRALEEQLRAEATQATAQAAAKTAAKTATQATPACEMDPVAGIVNTNEGDISSRFTSASVEEAISIGSQLAHEASLAMHESTDGHVAFDAKPALGARYVEVDLRSNAFGMKEPTCDAPEQGIFGALGATDHPTFLNMFRGSADPRDPKRTDCQAPKQAFFDPVKGLARGVRAFPTILPFAVARVGSEAITFVPAELTMTTGHRVDEIVRRNLERVAPDHPTDIHAVIAGLSNSYIQYVTTPEEYDVQGYEGTSTLFGKESAPLIANIAGALAARLYDDKAELPPATELDVAHGHQYYVGPERDRLPQGAGDPTLDELGAERGPVRLCSMPKAKPAAVCFFWTDGAPGVVPSTEPRWITLVGTSKKAPATTPAPGASPSTSSATPPTPAPAPAAAPAKTDAEMVLLDDRGVDFRTRIHHRFGDAWLWSTLVRPAALAPPVLLDWSVFDDWGSLSIRVDHDRKKYEVRSKEFSSQALPPPCSAELERLCGE